MVCGGIGFCGGHLDGQLLHNQLFGVVSHARLCLQKCTRTEMSVSAFSLQMKCVAESEMLKTCIGAIDFSSAACKQWF